MLEFIGKPKLVRPYHSGVVLLDLGQKPIKNFGVVYSYRTSANQPITALPTLADKSVKFSYAQIKIEVSGAGTGFRLDNLNLDSVDEMYIRSFVEYTDGTVDYGRYVGHEEK